MKIKIHFHIIACLITISGFSQTSEKIKGNKNVTTKITEIDPFNRLVIGDHFKINIKQGKTPSVQVVTDDNLHEVIEFNVVEGRLSFKTNKRITSSKKMEITVIYKNALNNIELKEDAELTGTSTLKVTNLLLKAKASSKAYLTIDADTINYVGAGKTKAKLNITTKSTTFTLSDNTSLETILNSETITIDMLQRANAKLEGNTINLTINADNSSVLKAEKLIAQTCNLITEGKANIDIETATNLIIEASGTTKTYIYGAPKIELIKFEDEAILRKK